MEEEGEGFERIEDGGGGFGCCLCSSCRWFCLAFLEEGFDGGVVPASGADAAVSRYGAAGLWEEENHAEETNQGDYG